jgi:hypothetical protein
MPMALVPAVKTDHIPGQQSPHQGGNGNFTGPQSEVGMIFEKCPGMATRLCFQQKPSQPFQIIFPIAVIPKDLAAFNPPDDDMMQNSWSIQAGSSRHNSFLISRSLSISIELFKGVPFFDAQGLLVESDPTAQSKARGGLFAVSLLGE